MGNDTPLLVVIIATLLLSYFIGFWPAVIIIITLSIFLVIYIDRDRKRNPEKWKKIDKEQEERKIAERKQAELEEEENRPKEALSYWEEYQSATKRIPKSEWILMSREEKADVFREREQIKDKFFELPIKTRELIKNKYKINTKFPNI